MDTYQREALDVLTKGDTMNEHLEQAKACVERSNEELHAAAQHIVAASTRLLADVSRRRQVPRQEPLMGRRAPAVGS